MFTPPQPDGAPNWCCIGRSTDHDLDPRRFRYAENLDAGFAARAAASHRASPRGRAAAPPRRRAAAPPRTVRAAVRDAGVDATVRCPPTPLSCKGSLFA
jgi:hypothetical protein